MTAAAAVEVRDVSRVLPGPVPVTLVKDVNLTLEAGEFVAVTGPSGSGKSSLLYLLGLLDRPSEGEIVLTGSSTAELDAAEAAAFRLARLGFVFQFHFLLPEFTAVDNVMLPMRKLGGRSAAQIRNRAKDLLEALGLGDRLHRRPDQLSGGERQRAAIARALANDPAIVLADEPTGNLDTVNAERVFETLGRLAREENRTVVVVTHNMELADRADRRIGLRDGQNVEDQDNNSKGA